jgi:hypothetical protein
VRSWCLRHGIFWESRGKGTSAVGSRDRATAIEDVTMDTSVGVGVCVVEVVNCKM